MDEGFTSRVSQSVSKEREATNSFLGLLLEMHEDDGRHGEEGCSGQGDLGAAGRHAGGEFGLRGPWLEQC